MNRPFPNQFVFYGPTEALFASIKVSFLAGIILSLPVVFYQCWKFIEPALLPKEQRWAIPLLLLAALLFALGLGASACSRHRPLIGPCFDAIPRLRFARG